MVFSFEQHRPSQALIHLDHLCHNVRVLRGLVGSDSFFCPMVKANAYGHGDIEVAKALESEGVRSLGVGLIEEGILLRGMGVRTEILVYSLMDARGAKACLEAQLTPVLSSWEQIRALKHVIPSGQRMKVHLKFDTGMHRLGFESSELAALVDHFEKCPEFQLQGVMTHLHSGEDADQSDGQSFQQLREFQRLAEPFQKWTRNTHALNSAGLLNMAKLRQLGQTSIQGVSLSHGARPGLSLYGISPIEGTEVLAPLKPVMSLRSKVVRLKKIEVGQGVSYCHTWKAQRPSWIGVVPMGYADGYHRLLSNRAEVLIEGFRAPVVGNVCMDYFMIDLTGLIATRSPTTFLWKEVTLFGQDADGNELSVIELAKKSQTIPWEILTSVGERVPRVMQGKDKA